MTTKVELLPLPLPSSDYPYAYDGDDMKNYALANVASAVAPLHAEIEAMRAEVERDKALLRQALTALESSDWYIGQLEWIVYSPDDTGTHEERAKAQSTIAALRLRLGKGMEQKA